MTQPTDEEVERVARAICKRAKRNPDYRLGPHPSYGPCDALAAGGNCSECMRMLRMLRISREDAGALLMLVDREQGRAGHSSHYEEKLARIEAALRNALGVWHDMIDAARGGEMKILALIVLLAMSGAVAAFLMLRDRDLYWGDWRKPMDEAFLTQCRAKTQDCILLEGMIGPPGRYNVPDRCIKYDPKTGMPVYIWRPSVDESGNIDCVEGRK